MNNEEIKERLKQLQKWCPWTQCDYGTASIDWEEDDNGEWIKLEDVQKLIEELSNSTLIVKRPNDMFKIDTDVT